MRHTTKAFLRFVRKIQREANYLSDARKYKGLLNQTHHRVPLDNTAPVVFMNVSSRLEGISQNFAFSMLASFAVRASGVPVIHFVCQAGMSRCMLGTNWRLPYENPPCSACIKQSKRISTKDETRYFRYEKDQALASLLAEKTFQELEDFSYQGLPLGQLTLTSLRWSMRQHHILDTEESRFLFREFILSAWNVAKNFTHLLEQEKPACVVVFNGQTFPEAVVKHVAKERNIPVVTHEVAIRPLSAFFSHGEATAYPIDLPDEFQLNDEQNLRLETYLNQRRKGNFTMAGIRFWPAMIGLDQTVGKIPPRFTNLVSVFTNVVFDTSQIHANTIFTSMFDWLDSLLLIIHKFPHILFVIRAHPDESRPGKESRESVAQWAQMNRIVDYSNIVFIDSTEKISSYELIQQSKFVMTYNSTIGLEAVILGKFVLAAGRSRFTQIPIVCFPSDAQEYEKILSKMLTDDKIEQPEKHVINARRFLYYQLFRTSLMLDPYIFPDEQMPGYVHFRHLLLDEIREQKINVLNVIADGIIRGKPFMMPECEKKSSDS